MGKQVSDSTLGIPPQVEEYENVDTLYPEDKQLILNYMFDKNLEMRYLYFKCNHLYILKYVLICDRKYLHAYFVFGCNI